MKKGIVVLLALTAVAAWATDVNPWQARSDSTSGQPSAALSGNQVKALWDDGDALNSTQLSYISADEGTKYNPAGSDTWSWIMVRLKHANPADSYTLNWEAYTDSYDDYGMSVYVWDNASENWDWLDTGPQAIFTTARTVSLSSSYWYWNSDESAYVCLVLVEGRTVVGERDMHVDVVDASY
ncbi:MAG: hypothetical protein PVH29_13225 [Candidatus Zixiibacteriota bacterium]|jgi:hypothetical protein